MTLDLDKTVLASRVEQQLQKMQAHPGFIAALDQSGGSTPHALRAYGIAEGAWSSDEEMFALVHQMRTRIITSPRFTGELILGAILFENTMDRDIERVVALSGGYPQKEGNDRLRRNHGVVASFSRALLEGLSAGQSDDEYNAVLGGSIQRIYEASIA